MRNILSAHAYARERVALDRYRRERRRVIEGRGSVFVAWAERARWRAFRDLIDGAERAAAELERAELAA